MVHWRSNLCAANLKILVHYKKKVKNQHPAKVEFVPTYLPC